MKTKKRFLSIMLSMTLTLGVTLGIHLTTYAADVNVTQSTYEWTDGNTYIVDGDVTIAYNRIKVTGDVTLKLQSGTLTAEEGIEVNEGNKLTIEGNGTLVAKGTNSFANSNAAIGGSKNNSCGTIVINGGNITADSSSGAAGIGGGNSGSGGHITINNGTVTAKTLANAAGIGGGSGGDGGNIVINGGTIKASSEQSGAGIGGGGASGLGGNITINGGKVNAEAKDSGFPGIGAYADWGTIIITGGTVEAQAGSYTAGIGGGYRNNAGSITITGGNVTANGKGGGAGIGAGRYCQDVGTITITGGNITAASNSNGAEGIGKADESASVTLIIGDNVVVYSSDSEITDVTTIPAENKTTGPVDNVTARAKFMKVLTVYPAEIETAPKAVSYLIETGTAQELVTAGVKGDGAKEIQFALGEDNKNVPTDGWATTIPTGIREGTYYVWYKAIGDSSHSDSNPTCLSVTIEKKTGHKHEIEHVEAKDPTCTEDGYEAHYECTICHEWFGDETGSVPLDKKDYTKKATGHRWDRGVVTEEATYDETGIKTYTCSVCGETKDETIPVKTGSSSSSSDSSDSSSGASSGKSGSISTKSIDVNGNTVQTQPDSGAPLSDRGGNWGNQEYDWTYTKSDGSLAKGEWMNLEYDGHIYWYYFDDSTIMQTNWFDYNGATYFLVPEMDGWRGRMATGWHMVDNKWYYFEPTIGANQGILLRGMTTPDGHMVGADGAWDGNGTTPVGAVHTGTTVTMN